MKYSFRYIKQISGSEAETSDEIIAFGNELMNTVKAKLEFIQSIHDLVVPLNERSLAEAKDALALIRQFHQVAYYCCAHFQNIPSLKESFKEMYYSIGQKLKAAKSSYQSLESYFDDNYDFSLVVV